MHLIKIIQLFQKMKLSMLYQHFDFIIYSKKNFCVNKIVLKRQDEKWNFLKRHTLYLHVKQPSKQVLEKVSRIMTLKYYFIFTFDKMTKNNLFNLKIKLFFILLLQFYNFCASSSQSSQLTSSYSRSSATSIISFFSSTSVFSLWIHSLNLMDGSVEWWNELKREGNYAGRKNSVVADSIENDEFRHASDITFTEEKYSTS